MKSPLRWSRASGSTRRRVEKLIKLGWFPGCRLSDLIRNRRRDRQAVSNE